MKNNSEKCAACPNASEYEYRGKMLCSPCVSKAAAEVEEPATEMNCKPPRNRGKDIDEIEVRKDFSGEASPYWEHMAGLFRQRPDGEIQEFAQANPDVCSEEDSPYLRPLTEQGELQMEVIRDVIAGLTPYQRQVLNVCTSGPEGCASEEDAAAELGITRRALRTILGRIRSTVQQKYEQRLQSSKWQK